MSYFVYILYCNAIDKYYIGSTQDINVRLEQHNSSKNKSTKNGVPWELKKLEEYSTRQEAVQREQHIKKMKSKKFTEQVIAGLR